MPAFQARDLALALEQRVNGLPPERRDKAIPAIERLVRMAWLLDATGDVGNRQQLLDAYAVFSSAVAELTGAFGG